MLGRKWDMTCCCCCCCSCCCWRSSSSSSSSRGRRRRCKCQGRRDCNMADLGVVDLVLETDPSGKGDAENKIE